MSDDKNKRFKPGCSDKLIPQRYEASVQNVPEDGSYGDEIQDQIIIAPEIMRKILEQLDLRNLKKVRLVCKSWLQEAQPHLERRGMGLLHDSSGPSSKLKKFIKTREKNISALVTPFRCIDVSLGQPGRTILWWIVKRIKNLNSPLMITRFSQGGIPVKLAIKLVTQHSSSLEYLKLSLQGTDGTEAFPSLSPEQNFPNLRHLAIGTKNMRFIDDQVTLIARIVQGSPDLATYEYTSVSRNETEEVMSILLFLNVNIENVKTLKLSMDNRVAIFHLGTITFLHLENLKVVFPRHSPLQLNHHPLTTTLTKSATTLKKLNLSRYAGLGNVEEFPICPCVEELTLDSFPNSNHFLSGRFPSLQVLNVTSVDVDVLENLWTDLPPISGVKTLRVKEDVRLRGWDGTGQRHIRFLNKFPDLERVRLDYAFVIHCCRRIATGHFQVSDLLGGVKHLELNGLDVGSWGDEDHYAPLAALTGIETLALVNPNASLVRIPFQDMLSLKVIRFPWGKCLTTRKLSAIAKGLEKVVIFNCCSFLRAHDDSWPSKNLESFFDSAPNAVCGCKEWKETSPEWD